MVDEICIKAMEAVLTYVAIDKDHRPRMVPPEYWNSLSALSVAVDSMNKISR